MRVVIGTCGNCGGPVSYDDFSGYMPPSSAWCQYCFAIPKAPWGPVLDMRNQPTTPPPPSKPAPENVLINEATQQPIQPRKT